MLSMRERGEQKQTSEIRYGSMTTPAKGKLHLIKRVELERLVGRADRSSDLGHCLCRTPFLILF